MLRRMFLVAIRFYQRYLSPYKGFCCAYRKHTGRQSCSALGYRAIRRFGVNGLVLLRQRTYLCGVAYRRYGQPVKGPATQKPYRRPHRLQRGDCSCDIPSDLSCDLPDLPDLDCKLPRGHCTMDICDFCSGCDIGNCEWPRKDKQQKDEKYVYIPPKAGTAAPWS